MPATEEFQNKPSQTANSAGRCSRRDFLRLTSLVGASLAFAACGGVTPLVPPSEPELQGGAGAAQNAYWAPFQVVVDQEKCTGCEECVWSCPASVLQLVDGKANPIAHPEECLGCETCMEVCEFDAVRVFET